MNDKTDVRKDQYWKGYWNLIRDLCTYELENIDIYRPLSGGRIIDTREKPSDKLLAIAWIEVHNALAKEGETIYSTDISKLDENDQKLWKYIHKEDHIYAENNPSKAAFLAFIGLLTLNTRERKGAPIRVGLFLFQDILNTLPEYMTQLQNCGFNQSVLGEMSSKASKLKEQYNCINQTVLPNIANSLKLTGSEKLTATPVNTEQSIAATPPVSAARSINTEESQTSSISVEESQPLLAPVSAGNFNFRRVGQYILAGTAASVFVGAVAVIGAVAGAGLVGGLIAAGTLGMGMPLGIAIGGIAGAAIGAVSGAAITGIVMAVAYFWKRPGSNPGGGGGSKNNSNQEPDSMVSSHARIRSQFPSEGVSKKPTQTSENKAVVQVVMNDGNPQETKKRTRGEASGSRSAPRF